MKIIIIIHGYPPIYNAGSEVYSQMLAQALSNNHEVHVFTRQENPFLADYILEKQKDLLDPRINLYKINLLTERNRYRYKHPQLDEKFGNILDTVKPDVAHVGHLNHLSTSLIFEIQKRNIPIIFTLHDYWLMCPRGQFIQRIGKDPNDLWAVCNGQENKKCAIHCYSAYSPREINYWENWVAERMQHIREILPAVDYFIAPSHYLRQRFINDFHVPENKIIYMDYGFDLSRFKIPRKRLDEKLFTFGYIGTHIPAKGIQDLIKAFGILKDNSQLKIWGRQTDNTAGLKKIVQSLPEEKQKNIFWMDEYQNQHIVKKVFNQIDAIVVPSIWVENSPLVIHEAQLAKLPIITANIGGMAEYISHETNGLLFEHRDILDLTKQMQRFIDEPSFAISLGEKSGKIINMFDHIKQIESIYHLALKKWIL